MHVRAILSGLLLFTSFSLLAADKPQRERIRLLSSAGLAPLEIAKALGTTANTVRVALVGIRKSGGRRRTRK